MEITPDRCRLGRAVLGWSLNDMARATGIDRSTIYRFECGKQHPHKAKRRRKRETETLAKLGRALEDAGIEFGEDGWVRVRPVGVEAP